MSVHVQHVSITSANENIMVMSLSKLTDPLSEVNVNLSGLWTISHCPTKQPKLSTDSNSKPTMPKLQLLVLSMINPITNLIKLIAVADKESHTITCAFDCAWLCCHPQLTISASMTKVPSLLDLNSKNSSISMAFAPATLQWPTLSAMKS